jgi:two-component system phosphate regulon sensor histidine kinase PhoR
VPLRRGREIIGILEVVTKHATRRFGADEQALMSAFADQAAVAIDNARLLDQGRQHLERVVEANRQLEELDRLRREYLRNVSHEFRTPLTVIRGYAEFLENAKADARTVSDVMRVIVESCDRVIDLVDTLIEVSRVEQEDAARTLQLQELDLKELAEASLEPLRQTADRKSVCLDLDFPVERRLLVNGDRGLLGHLVRKLVDNAVKYSPAGARVLVRGGRDGDDLTLEVEDFGIGIPAEHVPRIFEKFYMVDGGITRRAGGSGVGLYLVREIVRLHHGHVDVESRPGHGSVFRIRLPRHTFGEAARA